MENRWIKGGLYVDDRWSCKILEAVGYFSCVTYKLIYKKIIAETNIINVMILSLCKGFPYRKDPRWDERRITFCPSSGLSQGPCDKRVFCVDLMRMRSKFATIISEAVPILGYRVDTFLPLPLIPPPAGDTWRLGRSYILLSEGAGGRKITFPNICAHTIESPGIPYEV